MAGGSTVPGRHLGRMLRTLRARAAMTLDGAAQAAGFGRQKLWRVEAGRGTVTGRDVRALCELYAASPTLTNALVALAGETTAKGWWHAYDHPVPAWLDLYPGLEADAARLREHSQTLIPALLRTADYATALHRPDPADPRVPRQVRRLPRRQELLHRHTPAPPRLDVTLSEAVLLSRAGEPATMAAQLRHLLRVGRLPHVTIRVVPLDAGAHPGALAGSFVLLDFPPRNRTVTDPPVVYRESLTGALYLDREEEITAYERVWAGLETLALDETESARLIEKTAVEVHG
jgi:transcriptional regulator with XRE-family HTH domain